MAGKFLHQHRKGLGLDAIGVFAQRAEALGYDGYFCRRCHTRRFVVVLPALAATARIIVATSVLVAFPRSPMNVALAAWDLQRLSQGRFELGLGTQIRQNIEDRYSARWLPPVAGMREYLGALRAIFHSFRTGEPLRFEGEYFRFTRLQPFFNPGAIAAPNPPLMIGAVGANMLALSGHCADGLHTHPTSGARRYLQEMVLPNVARGATERVTDLPKPRLCINALVATGENETAVEKARAQFRQTLAFLFSTPAYWINLELHGWQDVGLQLQQLARAQRWDEMATVFNDELLDTFLVSGTYNTLPQNLIARFGDLADRVAVPPPITTDHDDAFAAMLLELRRLALQKI
ncbi:MAG: TIGR03617 family F420-dependent LLM class oxidoreductase [Pseudomonadales bacterium]